MHLLPQLPSGSRACASACLTKGGAPLVAGGEQFPPPHHGVFSGATAASSVSTPLHSHEATLTITQKTLRHTIQLHPRYLGQNLRDTLETQLRRDVEGTLEADAFVITVMGMNSDSSVQGTVNAQSGFVTFEVTYDAILFRAFKHEVLLGEVSAVTTQGIFVDSGPLSTFIISLVRSSFSR